MGKSGIRLEPLLRNNMKGQNTKSIRSKSLNNTRLPVVGSKSIVFFHQANDNEQYIDITNLVTPSNTVNPSPSELAKARLKDFETNFELISSANGSLMNLAYEVVSNTTIKLKYPASQGEIFEGRLHNYITNGTLIADVRTPSASGELLENQRDYNLGEAILIKDLTNQWPIQVFRGSTGTPMLRNIGNATFVSDQTIGNYGMLDRGDGYCQVIRFNIAGDVGNEPIMWASHGALGERPNLSVLQRVDKLNGVIDRLRQDTLVGFGYDVSDPTRYDGGVPTQSDLKAFGDKVLALENILKNTTVFASSEWTSFTPAGTWAGTYTGMHRRVGDSMEIKIYFTSSGSQTGDLFINMPSGFSIDTSKEIYRDVGTANFVDAGIREYVGSARIFTAPDHFSFFHAEASGSGNINSISPFTWGAGDELGMRVVVPILGWTDRVSLI